MGLLAPRFRHWMGLALLAACALLGTPDSRAADLRIGLMNLARNPDPHLGANRADYQLHDQIYEGLAGVDAGFQPVPRLAERWEQTADGAWLFHLRRGVRFQNGQGFTARDVLYSFCRVGRVGPEPRALAARLAGVKLVEAPDPFTILIRHETKVAIFPSDVASVPIVAAPPDLVVNFAPGGCRGENWGDSARYADPTLGAGTGPYRLSRFAPDDMVVDRNPDYWGSPPGWDHVHLIRLTEKERVTAIVEGRIDILDNPSPESLPFLTRRPDLTLVEGPSTGVTYLQSNQRAADGPTGPNRFRDQRVRRALLLTVPATLLAERIVPGYGTPTGQMAMPGMEAYASDIPADEHDLTEARRLLAEAGLADGFDTTLMVTPMQVKIGDAIAHFLAMVNIRATVQVAPMDVYIERLRKGEFELFYGGWIFNPANMPDSLLALLGRGVDGTGRGAHNYGGYCNAAIDEKLRAALAEPDAGRRIRMLQDVARALHDDAAWIPIMHAQGRWLMRDGIRMEPRLDRMLLAREITAEPATR